ncbi:hypothetical protein [uncultured Fibrobacter sp.]|uniref:hypothetical protein n=1 Tax=uncultured Fibrobacter sp. TaxID=261512 RepID=UPI002805CCF8|nr:hypothetical protein [uncultured Fibrobacter sp.]
MEIYKLLPNKDGLIAFQKDGQTILVDTGLADSFGGANAPLEICGVTVPFQRDLSELPLCGRNPEIVSRILDGVAVDRILGLSGLSPFKIIVDASAHRIQFDTEDISLSHDWHSVEIEMVGGCLFVSIWLNGVPRKLLLDSGTPTSFADSLWLDACVRKADRQDFHLLSGAETASVYRALSKIAGFTFPIRYSVLSDALRKKIESLNHLPAGTVNGILGSALLENHRGYLDVASGIFKVMQ